MKEVLRTLAIAALAAAVAWTVWKFLSWGIITLLASL